MYFNEFASGGVVTLTSDSKGRGLNPSYAVIDVSTQNPCPQYYMLLKDFSF